MDVLTFPTRGALALAPATVCPMCDRIVTPSNASIERADGVIVHTECARVKPFIQPSGQRTETAYGHSIAMLEGWAWRVYQSFKRNPDDSCEFTFTDAHGRKAMVTGLNEVHATAIAYQFVEGQRRAIARAGRAAS